MASAMPDLPDPVCGGCHQELDEESSNAGTFISFANSLWHLDCFRCAKCNNKVTTGQDDLLLLSDGHPICSDCSYTCQVCHLPILEEAILTGDEAYHASCFTCRVCTKRIEELVFAKTSQGIYCMDCHHQRVERSKRHAEAKKAKAAAKAAAAAAAASGTSATLKPSSSSSSLKPDSRSAPRERSASVAPTTEPASTTSSPADKSGHRKASVASVASAASSPLLSTLSLGPDGGKASGSASPSSRPKPLRPLSLTRNHSGAGASLSPSHPSPIPSLKLFPAEEGDAQDADSGRKNRSASARANSIPSPPSSAPAHITTTAAAAAASANSTPPQGSSSSLRSTSPRIDTTPVSRGSRPSSLRTTTEDDGSTTRRGSSPGSSSAVSNTNTLSPSPDHAPTSRRTSANGRQNRNSVILGISGLDVTATGGSGGGRLSKTYSFYDPDFVNLMDSIGKLGSEDSDFSLTLPASGHDEGDATIPPATKPAATASGLTKATGLDAELARGSAFDRDEHDEDDGLGADDAEADRRMTLKPGSLAGYPVFSKLASGAADSESAATGLGSIPSASASMESFSLFDGYESTDSTSLLDDPSSSSRYLRTHSRSNTSDSHSLNADDNGDTMEHLEGGAGGESRSASALGGRIGSRRPSFAKSSSASSVLYSGSAVSEAEQRIRERADSAAKLMSRTRNGSTGSGGGGSHPPRAGSGSWFLSRDSRSGSLSAAESDLEADQGAPSTSVSGSSLTRDGTLRASSGGGKDAATTTTSRRGHQATGSTSGLNSYPLRKLSQRVKDKMPNLRSGKSSTGSNASGGAGSGSAPSAATAAAAKELIQLEPDLVEALLAQLDQARDQMESMQGKYNGMKRASRMAAHGYNVASQKFEVELNARYEAEVEMAALKRKLAEQTSKLTAVTGEAKRNEALMRRSQDVRSMVADMERSLAKLTVERDVRMAELAHLTATGVPSASAAAAGASSTTTKGKGDEDEAEEKEEKVKDKAGKENKDSTTASATSSGYFKDSLSPALISPPASISAPIGSSNPLLSPLLSAGPAKSPLGSAGAKASANGQQHADVTVSNLASRLESVKEKYKREIDDLVVERDSLLIEIDELRHNRDVFVNEGQALNARNEELSAQLNLLLKRLELGRQQEAMAVAAAATKARLGKKELPSVKGAAGGGSSSNGFFGGGGSKHRQHNSISSAAELANAQQQQGGPNQMHPSSSGSNTAIARPVRVGKAEQPVVKKFKWMKASAKTVSVGIAAAIPGAGSGNNSNSNSNSNSSNPNGSGSNGVPNGHVGLGPNGGPVGSPSGMNGHGPGVGSPAMGGGGSSVGGSNEGLNANGQQQQQQQQQQDGIVVREHLFQPFNILRPIRCFACQKNMWGQTEVRCALCGQSCHHKCLQNLPTSCLQPFSRPGDEPTEPAGPSMFGRDLVEQASAEGREVPEIVEKCVAAVEASGMDYEGIYRKSGGTSQLRVITQLFERGQPFDLQDMDRFNDVSAITSVLKNYFRELPVPLLTFDLHEAFIGIAEMRVDYEQKMERMADLIAQLPNVHFWTLRCLIVHLHRVQSRSDENRMSSRNLGVVFGPTLMRSSDTSREFAQMGGKAMTIEFFIDNPSLFSV